MKKKLIVIAGFLVLLVLGAGVTYSAFNSSASMKTNQNIAKFVFEANQTDHIELPLYDLKPGDTKDYKFSVSNGKSLDDIISLSDVTINYEIIVSTYHFIPLNIELYSVVDDKEEVIMTCDENNYSRDENNILKCTSDTLGMNYNSTKLDNYLIRITFDEKYNTYEYSDLVDFIDVEINSWQKVGE